MDALFKYPRTRHIEGSGLQKGDQDLDRVPFVELVGKNLVVEEKLDGANVGISFSTSTGALQLQCRGHFLTGGPRERQFGLLKPWAETHQGWLRERLATRYVLYAEWLYAKHTVFYDTLPHYLMEFDVLDRHTGAFLSTPRRQALLGGPVVAVPVLRTGALRRQDELTGLVRPSLYKSAGWRERLAAEAQSAGVDPAFVLAHETDDSPLAEGLYIKWEDDEQVLGRYKWVRPGFLQAILDSGTHWQDRPLLPNGLIDEAALWTPC